jgi:hypothetical protein
MAEITPAISLTNYFTLDAAFGINLADETEFQQFHTVFNATGNLLCTAEWDTGDNYKNVAEYCGGVSPDIVASLATFLTTFGDVENSIEVNKIEIKFEAGKPAELTIDGHQHDTNPHLDGTLRAFDASSIIPAASGLGCPDLITVEGDVSPVSETVVFETVHVDKPGAAGTHFSGQNIRCRVSISVDYEGQPSGVTAGNWLNIILAKSSPNDDTPTSSLTAEQFIDAT